MTKSYPVYIVDDDAHMRAWLRALCAEHQLACQEYRDGAGFLGAMDGLDPGCVLLDMRMPRRSGLDVQQQIAERGARMAVIAMTGYGDPGVAVQSVKLGAVDFLEKPFVADALLAALEQGFRRLDRREV